MTRILRYSVVPYIIVLILSVSFLFTIKYKVQNLSKELRVLNAEIISEKQNIHVLKAEFTYLSNPKRIKSLSDAHLNLKPVKSSQIYRDASEILKPNPKS